jgi:hypothetical protein
MKNCGFPLVPTTMPFFADSASIGVIVLQTMFFFLLSTMKRLAPLLKTKPPLAQDREGIDCSRMGEDCLVPSLTLLGLSIASVPGDPRGRAWRRSCRFPAHSRRLSQVRDWASRCRYSAPDDLFRKRGSSLCPYPHRASWPTHSIHRYNHSSPSRKPF